MFYYLVWLFACPIKRLLNAYEHAKFVVRLNKRSTVENAANGTIHGGERYPLIQCLKLIDTASKTYQQTIWALSKTLKPTKTGVLCSANIDPKTEQFRGKTGVKNRT